MPTRLPSLLLALVATASVAGVFLGTAPLALKLTIAAMVALAMWRPADGLVAVAAFAPLGGGLAALTHSSRSWSLPLVCAFLAGVAIRESIQPREPQDRAVMAVAGVWVAIVFLSLGVGIAAQRPASQPPTVFLAEFLTWLVQKFPMTALRDFPGVSAAALASSGAALFAVAVTLCRRDPTLAARTISALVLSVGALGALNFNRLVEAALRRPPVLEALVNLHQMLRINTTFTDVNAAGALFVLMIPVAAGLAGVRGYRWLALTTIPFLLAGAWLSGSRTALAMLPVSVAVLIIARTAHRSGRAWAVAAALLASVIALSTLVVLTYPRTPAHGSIVVAYGVRRDLVTTTLRMVREAPFFGVGIGRYYDRSTQFMPPRLRRQYRSQNAHNQFLQVLGELGVIGLAAFAAMVAVGVGPALRMLSQRARDPLLAGVTIGCMTLLVIALGMHPLLTAEVAIVFYLVLAVSRAAASASTRASVS